MAIRLTSSPARSIGGSSTMMMMSRTTSRWVTVLLMITASTIQVWSFVTHDLVFSKSRRRSVDSFLAATRRPGVLSIKRSAGGGKSTLQRPSLATTKRTKTSKANSNQDTIGQEEMNPIFISSTTGDVPESTSSADGTPEASLPAAPGNPKPGASRWESLNPKVKARLVKAGQERAIANKKKREPIQDKKRRVMFFVKSKQQEKKRQSRVQRPLSFHDRTPLSALIPGMELTGCVISLVPYGAYVDVGTECDGLLHISQITQTFFVQHPRQVLTPGEEITLRVRSVNPALKKLHLSMLPAEVMLAQSADRLDPTDRIPLQEIQVDDELWGELKRVTDYGAYVEVGAVVDGWLHFMDHPAFGWSVGSHPQTFMKVGDRVRVWVAHIDLEEQRIKLTANRPAHLPGPRREI